MFTVCTRFNANGPKCYMCTMCCVHFCLFTCTRVLAEKNKQHRIENSQSRCIQNSQCIDSPKNKNALWMNNKILTPNPKRQKLLDSGFLVFLAEMIWRTLTEQLTIHTHNPIFNANICISKNGYRWLVRLVGLARFYRFTRFNRMGEWENLLLHTTRH